MKNVIQSILGTFFFASLAVPVWSLPTDGMAASLREASVESTLEWLLIRIRIHCRE